MMRFPPFGAWSLKSKFALCSGALMFACLGTFAIVTLQAVQSDLVGTVTDAQKALVRSTADDIDGKIEVRTLALIQTANALSESGAQRGPLSGVEAFFKSQPVTLGMFDGLGVVDTAGRMVYNTDQRVAREGARVTRRPYLAKVLAGAPSAMSSPFRAGLDSGRLLVVFAAPLHGADGKVSGALLGAIDLQRPNFLGRLAEARIGTAGRFTLIEKGDPPFVVVHTDPRRILAPLDPKSDPGLARALAGFEGTSQGYAGGVEALRTTISLRSAPWVLVAVYPSAEAFAGLRVRQRNFFWVAGGVCLLASGIAWWLARSMLSPLSRLQTLMALHGSDRGEPIPSAGFESVELATLVAAYNAQMLRRRDFEDRLKASERRMRDITDNMPVLISHVDRDERHLFLNATFKTWLGIDPTTALGRGMAELMAPSEYAKRHDGIRRALGGERVSFEDETETPAGRRVFHTVYIPDRGPDGAVKGFYTLITDVTELKDAQHRLALLVRSDTLTGLPNRYQFDETLALALARCKRSGLALALMFLDIDHFKQINDSLGHAAGDTVLKEFARRLQQSVRTTDLAARLAGDEFVVVLEGLQNDAEPHAVARKILAEVNRPFDVDGRCLTVTTSVGVAFHAGARTTPKAILGDADAALYKAKEAGRNTYRLVSA